MVPRHAAPPREVSDAPWAAASAFQSIIPHGCVDVKWSAIVSCPHSRRCSRFGVGHSRRQGRFRGPGCWARARHRAPARSGCDVSLRTSSLLEQLRCGGSGTASRPPARRARDPAGRSPPGRGGWEAARSAPTDTERRMSKGGGTAAGRCHVCASGDIPPSTPTTCASL